MVLPSPHGSLSILSYVFSFGGVCEIDIEFGVQEILKVLSIRRVFEKFDLVTEAATGGVL